MIFGHRQAARSIHPEKQGNPRLLELQVVEEILAEIFYARPADIEKMIQSMLEERSWAVGANVGI